MEKGWTKIFITQDEKISMLLSSILNEQGINAVSINKKDLGKILISEKYPFGLIKFKDENFDFNKKLNCGSALIKILRPEWLK